MWRTIDWVLRCRGCGYYVYGLDEAASHQESCQDCQEAGFEVVEEK